MHGWSELRSPERLADLEVQTDVPSRSLPTKITLFSVVHTRPDPMRTAVRLSARAQSFVKSVIPAARLQSPKVCIPNRKVRTMASNEAAASQANAS